MCDCIKNLEKDLIGRIIDRKKVVKAKLIVPYITLGAACPQTNSAIELELEGQKKKVTKAVYHKYCSFCGQPYPEDTSWKPVNP